MVKKKVLTMMQQLVEIDFLQENLTAVFLASHMAVEDI